MVFVLQHDLVASSLEAQLEILATVYSSTEKPTFEVIKSYVISLSLVQRTSISEICIIVKLILVSPATNAISEHSASVLRRVQTSLVQLCHKCVLITC